MTDVGVIGGGPVGLALACSLAARGRSCTVYEKLREKPQVSKAFALHARTLELLRPLGLDQRIVEEGRAIRRMNLYAEKRRLGTVDFKHLGSEFPYFISIPQYRLEALLAERLRELGGEVRAGHDWVALAQDSGTVRCTFDADGARVEREHPWLVGADGAHSAVRRSLGLDFAGDTYDSEFLVVDAEVRWPGNVYEAHTFLSRRGYLMLMPFPGRRHRIVTDLAAGQFTQTPDLAQVQRLLDERGFPELQLSAPDWIGTTRYHRRLASAFRQGRVFLAGDACHIHSPIGGQGLNTGLQDAFNLGWRLAMVQDGRAGDALLDGYDVERRAVARAVLQATDKMTQRFATRNPIQVGLRNLLLPLAFSSPRVQRKLVADAAGVAIGYGAPGERRRADHPLLTGERLPDLPVHVGPSTDRLHRRLHPAHHTLIVLDGEGRFDQPPALDALCRGFEDLVRPLLVGRSGRPAGREAALALDDAHWPRLAGAGAGSVCVLVRPDGYVAQSAAGVDPAPLLEKLRARHA